jgi:hypothetical protein
MNHDFVEIIIKTTGLVFKCFLGILIEIKIPRSAIPTLWKGEL